MEDRLKRRLIGATVVVALVVIFLPMLVEKEKIEPPRLSSAQIPPKPQVDEALRSRLLPDPEKPIAPVLPPKPSEVGDSGRWQMPVEAPAAVAQPEPKPRVEPSSAPHSEPKSPQPAPPTSVALVAPPAVPPTPSPVPKGPTTAPPAGTSRWVVQVAAYTSSAKADSLASRLNAKGYRAFVEPAVVNGTEYFRVRIGPEGDRGRTAQLAEKLAKDLKVDAQVKRYP